MTGRYSREKGARGERDLVKYLRRWWPKAERMVRTGFRTQDRTVADPGDVTGTPGVVWSMKDVADARVEAWMAELDAMEAAETDIKLLVHKRAGYADPGRWWCWMRQRTYLHMAGIDFTPQAVDQEALVRVELNTAIQWLGARGDIPPMEEEAAA